MWAAVRQDEGGAQGNCAQATLTIWVGVGRSRDVLYNCARKVTDNAPHRQTNKPESSFEHCLSPGFDAQSEHRLGILLEDGGENRGGQREYRCTVREILHFASLHLTRKSKQCES